MLKTLLVALGIAICGAEAEAADWIRNMTSEDCRPQSRDRIASAVRRQIEHAVHRAENSVQRHSPIGSLACLDGLMNLSFGGFAPVGDLGQLFRNTLDQSLGNGSRQVCRFAEDAWRRRSRPLEFGAIMRSLPARGQSRPLRSENAIWESILSGGSN